MNLLAILALKSLWRHKWALLLQVLTLGVAIGTLAATERLRLEATSTTIQGAGCADGVVELIGTRRNGVVEDAWTQRQASALAEILRGVAQSPMAYSGAEISTRHGRRVVSVGYVGPDYFSMLCVRRTDLSGRPITAAPYTGGALVESGLLSEMTEPRNLLAERRPIAISGGVTDFRGVMPKLQPVDAWLPYSNYEQATAGAPQGDVGVVHLYLKPNPGDAARVLQLVLTGARARSGMFGNIESFQLAGTLTVSPWGTDQLKRVAWLLGIFSIALTAMVVVNLISYHSAKLAANRSIASILIAVGAPLTALRWFAALEPVIVGALAMAAGTMLSVPIALAATGALAEGLDINGGVFNATAIFLAFVILAAITLVIVHVKLTSLRKQMSKGQARRGLVRVLPRLLTLQVAFAIATLTLGSQSAIGVLEAIPPHPNFSLEGLSVLTFEQSSNAPDQDNLEARWQAAWNGHSIPGFKAALSTSRSPFLPTFGTRGTLYMGSSSTPAFFAHVTADFFDVLGTPIPGAKSFLTSEPTDREEANSRVLILSRLAASRLSSKPIPTGFVLSAQSDLPRSVDAAVLGILDDGLIGARGVKGSFDPARLSLQGPVPVAYLPLTSLKGRDRIMVFVRHPPALTPVQVATQITPAVREILPTATVYSASSGEDLFREPLGRERAVALVLGLLAMASLVVAVLGLVALSRMFSEALKLEIAVGFAVGMTKGQAIAILLRKLLTPIGVGFLIGVVPAIIGSEFLSDSVPLMRTATIPGAIVGLLALLIVVVSIIARTRADLLRASFADWLHYD